jgi:hypothetical protein
MSPESIPSPSESMGLTGAEQARSAGISARKFDYWCINGWVYPGSDGAGRPGSGEPRRTLTDDEVRHLALMKELVDEGLRPGKACSLACRILAHGSARFGSFVLTREADESEGWGLHGGPHEVWDAT